MAMPGSYGSNGRDRTKVYTPSMDSDDDSLPFGNLTTNEKQYRQFRFTRDGPTWRDALWKESSISESELKKKAKRTPPKKKTVQYQMDKMGALRRNAIEDLVEQTIDQDPDHCDWSIVAIETENPEIVKRTAEVLAFTVILQRMTGGRQRRDSTASGRRKSFGGFAEVAGGQRSSKYYNGPSSPRASRDYQGGFSARNSRGQIYEEDLLDDRSGYVQVDPRASFGGRSSKPRVVQDDPFGVKPVFGSDGKALNVEGALPLDLNNSLPPYIKPDTAIGDKVNKKDGKNKSKDKKGKNKDKSSGGVADGVIDLDALLGGGGDGGDYDDDDDDDSSSSNSSSSDDTSSDKKGKRGRKRKDSGYDEKWKDHGKSKSKSKPRRPSLHIPTTFASRPQKIYHPSSSRPKQYHPKDNYNIHSATTGSVRSGDSIYEPEYEYYTSSSSSSDGHSNKAYRSDKAYKEYDARYHGAYKEHRRGPPSPNTSRYPPEAYRERSDNHRGGGRPRTERFLSEGQITRYTQPSYEPQTGRPIYITQHSVPRFSSTGFPAGMVPVSPTTRLEFDDRQPLVLSSAQDVEVAEAREHMRRMLDKERDRDRERELADRERELARREGEIMGFERGYGLSRANTIGGGGFVARSSEVSDRNVGLGVGGLGRAGASRYNYEPRTQGRRRESMGYNGGGSYYQ